MTSVQFCDTSENEHECETNRNGIALRITLKRDFFLNKKTWFLFCFFMYYYLHTLSAFNSADIYLHFKTILRYIMHIVLYVFVHSNNIWIKLKFIIATKVNIRAFIDSKIAARFQTIKVK